MPPALTAKEVPVPFHEPLAPDSVTVPRLAVRAPVVTLAAESSNVPLPEKVRCEAEVPLEMAPWITVAPLPAMVNVIAPVLAKAEAPEMIRLLPESIVLTSVRLEVPEPAVSAAVAWPSVMLEEPVKVAGSPPRVTGIEMVVSAVASMVPPLKVSSEDADERVFARMRRPWFIDVLPE